MSTQEQQDEIVRVLELSNQSFDSLCAGTSYDDVTTEEALLDLIDLNTVNEYEDGVDYNGTPITMYSLTA